MSLLLPLKMSLLGGLGVGRRARRSSSGLHTAVEFQTRTCEIFVGAGNDPAFQKFCELLDMPDLASDSRFATNSARVIHRDALTKKLNARFADEDGCELTRRMLAAGLPAGPVLNVDEAIAADHTAPRNMVTELGAYRLGTPIKLSRTPGGTRSAPPGSTSMARRCSAGVAFRKRKSKP